MIRTLLWKEYREQRMTVLALLVFAVGLLVCVQTLSDASRTGQSAYGAIAVCMMWMIGLIVGAQPFAGEVENRTLDWLDTQPAWRGQVGRVKLAFAALVVLGSALLLLAIGAATKWLEPQDYGLYVPTALVLGLGGLGCGLCGSAYAGSALAAIGIALGLNLILASFLLGKVVVFRTFSGQPLYIHQGFFAAIILLPLPFVFAYRRFTRIDRKRGARKLRADAGHSWRALRWLAWRQSRLTFAILFALGISAAIPLATGHNWQYWPPFGVAFGILAGVGAFAADRPGEAFRFLGDRRLPFGKVWFSKVAMRIAAALVPTLLFIAVISIRLMFENYRNAESGSSREHQQTRDLWLGLSAANLWLPPIYGFAVGLFLGMICRKGAVAVVLSAMVGALVLLAWWPSIIITGLHWWQWIAPPLVLIGATRLVMRPWTTGWLGTLRPGLQIAGAGVLALAAVAGGVWYRAVEPPVRADPFDMTAFAQSLPTVEQNVAGRKLLALLSSMPAVEKDPIEPPERGPDGEYLPSPFRRAMKAIDEQSWPSDDPTLNRWLDSYIASPWIAELQEAIALPLGMIEGPQTGPGGYDYALGRKARNAGSVLYARALQMAQQGKPVEAFDWLFQALRLSNQVRSKSMAYCFMIGGSIEYQALHLVPALINSAVGNHELLSSALNRLREHNAAVPPLGDTLRMAYANALAQASLSTWQIDGQASYAERQNMLRTAAQFPWELERTKGILATLYAGYHRTNELPYPEAIQRNSIDRIFVAWTPASIDAAEAQAERSQLLALLHHSIWESALGSSDMLFNSEMTGRVLRRGAELQLGLAVYQARNGKPAESLNDLVPSILSELPLDPYDDKPFNYRISAGERILRDRWYAYAGDAAYISIGAGQGVVWSVGADRIDTGGIYGGGFGWRWRDSSGDVIFLVPLLKKQ